MGKLSERYGADSYGHFDCYPFTREQANRIHRILVKKYDAALVDKFVDEVRDCCEGATCLILQKDEKNFQNDRKDRKTFQNDRKAMMRILEKSEKLLDEIRNGRGVWYVKNYAELVDGKRAGLEFECQELAVTTGNLLSILIRKLRLFDTEIEEKTKRGRPTADAQGIIKDLAGRWEKCFGKKPTKYLGGPFTDVVNIILEGLKLPYKYPDKKIREALK